MTGFAPLLAQSRIAERMMKVKGGFNDRPTDPADLTGVLLMILVPISIVLLILLSRNLYLRVKARHSSPAHPMRLFDLVLKRMGIHLGDRVLLRAFARAAHVNHPTTLLFSRETFDRHASQWLEKLSIRPIQRHARARMELVADCAFGPRPPQPASLLAINPFASPAPSPARPGRVDAMNDADDLEPRETGEFSGSTSE